MATPPSGVPYVLGDTDAEHARLIRQAAIFNPFTERLFRDAGVGPGQRGLDIGSGVGDIAMLVARRRPHGRGRWRRARREHDGEGEGPGRRSRASQCEFHGI
jgi:hypothetical protein